MRTMSLAPDTHLVEPTQAVLRPFVVRAQHVCGDPQKHASGQQVAGPARPSLSLWLGLPDGDRIVAVVTYYISGSLWVYKTSRLVGVGGGG